MEEWKREGMERNVGFGKHKKETFWSVWETNEAYCQWTLSVPNPRFEAFANFADWLRRGPSTVTDASDQRQHDQSVEIYRRVEGKNKDRKLCIRFHDRPDDDLIDAIKKSGGRWYSIGGESKCWHLPEENTSMLASNLRQQHSLSELLAPFIQAQPPRNGSRDKDETWTFPGKAPEAPLTRRRSTRVRKAPIR